MSTNIIDTLQRKLGFAPLQKVDPNIQETKNKAMHNPADRLAQAAVPAVLAGLFELTRTEEGTMKLIRGDLSGSWLATIFRERDRETVGKIAQYAGVSEEEARVSMEKVADESIVVLKEEIGNDLSYEKVEHFMNRQRRSILVHLPAVLQMGEILHDETLDDRTNKMEGPFSTTMNRIGNTLADGEQRKGTF